MKKSFLLRVLMLTALAAIIAGCGSEAVEEKKAARENSAGLSKESGRIKIIIDTDIGEDVDDILVAAFALNSPEFEVLAITTVDGRVEARSRIARARDTVGLRLCLGNAYRGFAFHQG